MDDLTSVFFVVALNISRGSLNNFKREVAMSGAPCGHIWPIGPTRSLDDIVRESNNELCNSVLRGHRLIESLKQQDEKSKPKEIQNLGVELNFLGRSKTRREILEDAEEAYKDAPSGSEEESVAWDQLWGLKMGLSGNDLSFKIEEGRRMRALLRNLST
ncbi:MAG: hypothetical protein WC229_02450 [Candidatus Paceibacterota bacterium]